MNLFWNSIVALNRAVWVCRRLVWQSYPLGMFGVGNSIPDDNLKEHLQHSPGLLVDQSRDPLDSSTASKASDGWLGDALDDV